MSYEAIDELLEALARKGLRVLKDKEFVGESGVKHQFPLVIFKEEKMLVFDHIDPEKPSNISALAAYVKAFDVKAEKCFLIVDRKERMEELKEVAEGLRSISLELIMKEELGDVIRGLMEDD